MLAAAMDLGPCSISPEMGVVDVEEAGPTRNDSIEWCIGMEWKAWPGPLVGVTCPLPPDGPEGRNAIGRITVLPWRNASSCLSVCYHEKEGSI